ncbi:DNA methyltransferase [Chloroflexota bacterium]
MSFEFKGYKPSEGQQWKYPLERLKELDREGRIYQNNPTRVPRLIWYLDEHPKDVTNRWTDISIHISERQYQYSRQKPLKLLERLIQRNSNPGDIVLDTFCGSGTTLVAAQNNDREWIGCDISEEACQITQTRLQGECELVSDRDYGFLDQQELTTQFEVFRTSAFPRYFISYSRSDQQDFVEPFCQKLEANMIEFWLDQKDIEIGERWRQRLQEGLKECETMILFLSPASLNSDYVREEYTKFLKAGKPIYQLMCKETFVPQELSEIQFLKFEQHDKLIDKLLRGLQA